MSDVIVSLFSSKNSFAKVDDDECLQKLIDPLTAVWVILRSMTYLIEMMSYPSYLYKSNDQFNCAVSKSLLFKLLMWVSLLPQTTWWTTDNDDALRHCIVQRHGGTCLHYVVIKIETPIIQDFSETKTFNFEISAGPKLEGSTF